MNDKARQMEPQDEMNLIEFLRMLWHQKGLILSTTVACLGLAIATIFFSKPVYEATAYITPPSLGDIAYVNQGRLLDNNKLFPNLQPDEVYKTFAEVLQSESFKRSFFKTVFFPSMQNKKDGYPEARLYVDFSNSLAINAIRAMPIANNSFSADYTVSFKGYAPEDDAMFVQKYIELAKQEAVNQFLRELNRQKKQLAYEFKGKISAIREIANSQRLDRIEQLQEAIKIAQVVDSKKSANSLIKTEALAINEPDMMYLRGAVALQAELANLSNRSASDAFVAKNLKLRETQGLYDFYRNISYNKDKVIMFRFDNEVSVREVGVATHKKRMILLALVAGLLIGIVLAILRKPLTLIMR
jgi:chain length determinant protein (polysaccharide antigen chain regulator)